MKEGIIERKLYSPHEDKKFTDRKFTAMKSYLDGSLDLVNAEHRPTPIDFQGLRPDSTEEDFFRWIEKETGIKPEIILADGNTQESAQTYRLLNYAYQRARNFLRDTLKYSEEEVFKNIEVKSINSKEDVLKLLSKVRLVAGNSGLTQSIRYCRIVKVTIAAYEALRNDSKLLKKITTDFEQALVSSPEEDGLVTDTPFVFSGKHSSIGKGFYITNHDEIEGVINSRAKEFEGVMLRFINRPQSDAKTALEDGIASRITIDKNQAITVLPILLEWLTKKMQVTDIKIENKSFFSPQHIKKVPRNFIISDSGSSSLSGGGFEGLVIKGKLHSSSHGGQFEIQLVDPNNRNEVDDMDHDKYDVKKFVAARTRLDGGCPEEVFEAFVNDAHTKSGLSIQNIKYTLLEKPDAPILKKKKKNGKYVYIASSVYKRWAEFKWIDDSLKEEIASLRK